MDLFKLRDWLQPIATIKERILSVYPHVFPVLLFIALEIQNASDVYRNLHALLISYLLMYLCIQALFALTGRVFLSGLLASITLLAFYTANFFRLAQTGQVLVPDDLNLARHLGSIFAFSSVSLHWLPVCSILCTAALNIPLFYASKRFRIAIGKRAAILAVSGTCLFLAFFARFSQDILFSTVMAYPSDDASYNDIYREQGALLGFYAVSVADEADEPEGYSPGYMETLASRIVVNPSAGSYGNSIKPDVIVVMSEAFWDPENLPNISFSEEPAPNLRNLRRVTASGNVLVPTYGGMTCNTEFEFLTGNAMAFAGYGDIPYYEEKTYIDRDNGRSLVGMFNANGYRTVALHTYTASFFERDSIYPKLGFDTFIAEDDLPGAHMKGSLSGQELISDEYFCDVLIDVIENTADPLFLFGITVQNHTPYNKDKYETTRIQADSGGLLSEEDEKGVEAYLEGIYDADAVLGRLYDYVMDADEPAILLYFGDHLPLLTQHTGVYTDLGFVGEGDMDDLSVEDAFKLHATPYIAFSNYTELPATWGDISPFFLGAVIAEAAGIEMNLYYHFLIQAFGSFQAMNQYLYIADDGLYSDPRESDKGIVEMFEAFQYDKLFGEGYLDNAMSGIP